MKCSISITKHYDLRWQIKDKPDYKISVCNNIFNAKTGRKLKQTLIGYTKGYWIGKKFMTLNKIRQNCELIPNIDIPF